MRYLAGLLTALVAFIAAVLFGKSREPSHLREAEELARKNLKETTEREAERVAGVVRDAESEIAKAKEVADVEIERSRSGGLAAMLRRRNRRGR